MFIGTGFLPIVILGILSFYSLKTFHRFDLASIENNLINQKIEEISGFVEGIVSTFQLKVAFEQVGDIEISSQHFLLGQLLGEFPDLQEAAFINLSGKETARFNRAFPAGVLPDELQDQSRLDKFIKAKDGKNYISNVYFTLSGPMVSIASPVLNKNNIVISVLAGEVNLKNLQKIIEKSRLGNIGYIYVVDNDGFLVAHSKSEMLNISNMRMVGFVNELLDNKYSANITIEAKNRYKSFWGESVIAGGKYVSGLGLAVIAEWPSKDAELVVNTLLFQTLVISLLVLIGTLFFSVFLADSIVKPIKSLEAGTGLIAQGQFDKPVLIKTGDELEDLSIAFNKMTEGLKRLEELKKEFVFIAAHELKTPVAVIKGYLSMIMEGDAGPVNDSVKDLMNKVINANQRLIQLVNDLLQIARAEAGKLTIQVAAIDVTEPIREIVKELKVLADEKKIQIIYEPAPSLLKAMADSGRLKEVMVNLVGNAVKYTLGSGTVTVSHEIKDKNLITHVKDTGMGISKENQKKLFEKFYRVQTDQTRDISGTGLGLFIVKQIIEKMNGRIWVESEEGKGSTFSFSLVIA